VLLCDVLLISFCCVVLCRASLCYTKLYCTALRRGRNEAVEAADRERFLEELEEDAEMRSRIALFRSTPAESVSAPRNAAAMAESDASSDGDGELPQIPLDELLDDLEALGLDEDEEQGADGEAPHSGGGTHMDTMEE
jgi:hypothetical protein